MEATSDYSGKMVESFIRFKEEDITVRYTEVQTVLPLIGSVQGLKLIDAGCGFGYFSLRFQEAGAQVTGTDVSAQQLSKAQELATKKGITGINFIHCGNENLSEHPQLQNSKFDLALAMFCLQYSSSVNALEKSLSSIRKLLKAENSKLVGAYPVTQAREIALKYGFETNFDKETSLPGSVFQNSVTFPDGETFQVREIYITKEIFEKAALDAGFSKVEFHNPVVSEEGIKAKGKEYWDDFVSIPVWQYFVCLA